MNATDWNCCIKFPGLWSNAYESELWAFSSLGCIKTARLECPRCQLTCVHFNTRNRHATSLSEIIASQELAKRALQSMGLHPVPCWGDYDCTACCQMQLLCCWELACVFLWSQYPVMWCMQVDTSQISMSTDVVNGYTLLCNLNIWAKHHVSVGTGQALLLLHELHYHFFLIF